MWSFLALIAALVLTATLVLLLSAWRLYRRDKAQRGFDLQVGRWLRDRSIRDLLLRRGLARLTYRGDSKSMSDQD
jgi:hypothetical protein